MLPSGLPEQIDNDEDVARFLVYGRQFSSTSVKPAAFLPNPKDGETSVSRHGREPADQLWQLGREAAGNRTLHGAAIIKAATVREATLELVADEPPERHAVIRGWPLLEADQELQQAKQKELAVFLAAAAGPPVQRSLG